MANADVLKAQKETRVFAKKPEKDKESMTYVLVGEGEVLAEKNQFGKRQVAFPVEYEGSDGIKKLTFTVGMPTIDDILSCKIGGKFDLLRRGTGNNTQWFVTVQK